VAKQSKITRDRIADKDIFTIGEDYAKSLQPAIQANKAWLDTFPAIKAAALEYAKIEKEFSQSKGKEQFLKTKEKEKTLSEQTSAALKEQDRAERTLISTIERKKIASEGTNRAVIQNRVELQQLNRRITETAKLSSTLSTEYEKQSIKLIQLQRRYKDVALTQGENSTAARALLTETQKLDATLKRVDANVGQFQRNVGNYGIAMQSAAGAARSLMSALGVVGGIALFTRVMRDAVGVVRDFEGQNATLSAILQVSKDEMQGLTDEAIRLGGETAKTAGEVTKLQIAYARLGFGQREIIDLTEASINGSIALNAELDETANLVGAIVNTFDDFSASDATEIIDILSLSTARSALNFKSLQSAIPTVAGAANAAGVPFTNLVALLGKLSDSGIDASVSATALRNIFIESAAQGLSYDQILDKIKNSTDKLTASNDEFGKRAAVSATVLANNIEAVSELDEVLQNAAGTAEGMAEKELNTLNGALTLLRSRWEGLILETDGANDISGRITRTIQFLTRNLETILRVIVFITGTWAAYRLIMFSINAVTGLYRSAVVGLTIAKTALTNGVRAATVQMQAFNIATKANPIGLLVGVVTTAAAAFLTFRGEVKKSAEELVAIKRRAEEARDAIVDTNIAIVQDKIRAIEADAANEEEAFNRKIDFITSEIEAQRSGRKLMEDFFEESDKKRVEQEEDTQKKLDAVIQQYANRRAQNRARQGADERNLLIPQGVDSDLGPDLTPAVAETAAQKTVKAYQKLLDELNESRKKADKERARESEEDRKKRLEKERQDEVALINFINQYKKETLLKFAGDQENEFETRIEAMEQAQKIELKLLEFNTQERLKTVRKGSNEEKLILAQTNKEKIEIEQRYYDLSIKMAADDIQKRAAIGKARKEEELARELERENQAFINREGIYEKEVNAVELREKRIAEIKKKYAIEALETQIKAIETLLNSETMSAQVRAETEAKLAELKLSLSEIVTSAYVEDAERRAIIEQETAQKIEDLSRQLAQALMDLINNLSQARIQKIDEEIRATDEGFQRQLDNERLTEEERKRIEESRDQRRKELEERRRREQRRQALLNKAMGSSEASINTAVAVTKVMPNPILVALTLALGAAQIAAIVSTPIPAYYLGTDNHPGGKALVGEYQPEVVTEPGKKPYIVDKPTIKHFPRGTKVTPSLEEYQALVKASLLTSIQSDGRRLNDFQTGQMFDKNSDAMLKELQLTRRALEKQKQNIHVHSGKVDFGHHLWKLNNLS